MSANSDRIRHLLDDIARIQRKIADLARDESRASEKIASATRSLSRARPSMAATYRKDIERNQDEIARIQRKRADQNSHLARKQDELSRAQKDLQREQDRAAQRSQDALNRLEKEARRRNSQALANITSTRVQPSLISEPDGQFAAFISHASEDKEEVARPLSEALTKLGHRIWFDEATLRVGDSLRRSIDRGLARSRFGIIVLSPSFFAKDWPQYELDGLVARENSGYKVILPLWHHVSKNDVLQRSPTLADRVALNTALFTIDELAQQLHDVLSS